MMTATKSQKGAATRDQILDAAARLIHLQGYHCTSLEDVLRESGVGKGNFYYYFRSKEELGYAILERLVTIFLARTLEPSFADPDADAVSQIEGFLDRVLANQRERNCVGGCPMGNLASELSDVHERAPGRFDDGAPGGGDGRARKADAHRYRARRSRRRARGGTAPR